MATREEAIAVLRAKGYKGQIPGEQPQQANPMQMLSQIQQQEPQDIAGLFSKINPVLGNTVRGLAQGGAQAFGGISPKSNENDLQKLYAQEAIKKQFNRTPYDDLIEKSKAIEAAKNTGNRTLYDELMGSQVQPNQSIPQQTQQGMPQGEQGQPEFAAPEIDPFTGKLSSKGIGQDYQNKIFQKQREQDIRSKSPTAKQKDDLANIGNVETLLLNMESDAAQVPSGYAGIRSQVGGFFSRGATDTSTVVYNDQRKAVAVALYRALTGDTRLSDADAAARALPLLWKPDEAQQVKTMKFQKLRQLLSDRKQAVSSNLGGQEESIQDPNDFSQMSDEELQQIASSA